MVAKTVTMASMLMPVAMIIGTGLAIVAYRYSATALAILIIICTVMLIGIIVKVISSQPVRRL